MKWIPVIAGAALAVATAAAAPATAVTAPTVSSVSPQFVRTGGRTVVTVVGTGFTGVTGVKFGTATVHNQHVVSATKLTVTTPAHSAGVVDLRVVTSHGTSATRTADRVTFVGAPTVASVAPTSGPRTGGTVVTLTGTNFRSVQSVKFGSTGGTQVAVQSPTHLTVHAPAHATGLTHVQVVTAFGQSNTSKTYTFDPAWSKRNLIDPGQGPLSSVSCPTEKACVAVDAFGHETRFTGQGWGPADSIDPGHGFTGVSCASVDVCVAVDDAGSSYVFNGFTWARRAVTSVPLNTVSCSTTTFCMTITSNSKVFTFDGNTWQSATQVTSDGNVNIVQVSCIGATSCVAADGNSAYVYRWNGTSWDRSDNPIDGTGPGSNFPLSGVSCKGPTLDCVAVTGNGKAIHYTGGSWQTPVTLNIGGVHGVSCGNTCVAVGGGYSVTSPNGGGTWNPAASVPGGGPLSAVSCVVDTCAAVSSDGEAVRGDISGGEASWGDADVVVPLHQGFSGVSCPDTNFCAAVDYGSSAFFYFNGRWGAAMNVAPGGHLVDVSCTSSTYCIAVDDDDYAFTWDGASWASQPFGSSILVRAVSCEAVGDCMAVGNFGSSQLVGTTWTYQSTSGAYLRDVSCIQGQCDAITDGGESWHWDGTSWTDAGAIDGGALSTAISCVQTNALGNDCFVTAYGGFYERVGNAGTWTLITGTPTQSALSVSCVFGLPSSSCVIGDADGQVAQHSSTGWTAALEVSSKPIWSVSCATATVCAAVDGGGGVSNLA